MLKKVEISTLIILIIFAFYCALTIGSSWDESYAMTIGKERLKYLFSLGSYKDYAFYRYDEFYPGFYNTLAIFVTKIFPNKYEIQIWHLTNTIFSISTVFGIYKITSNLFDKKVGKIVFLLCFLNPIFFGHMAMNSKDTMVAFAHVWSTYIFLRYLQTQNTTKNHNRYILLAGLTVGFGTGVRLPFIATLFPLMIFAIVDMFFFKTIISHKFSIKKFIIDLVKVLLIAYFIAISTWPDAHSNIFTEPFKLFMAQSKFQGFGGGWLLFNGNFFNTLSLPPSYIFINLIYKSPEFILISYVIFIYFIMVNKNFFSSQFNFFWNKMFLILFILLFPIISFIFLPYRVYDGLRLFLYIIPYFSIIPGLAIYYLINNFNALLPKLLLGVITSLFIYYLFIFFSFTPYQYTYLNKFIGNLSNAHKKFENDYWNISIKELINKIPRETNLISNNEKIKISYCGVAHDLAKRELNKLKNIRYEVMDLHAKNFDYIIMTNRASADKDADILDNVKGCFEKVKGEDLVTVERNGLMLSTLRKRL